MTMTFGEFKDLCQSRGVHSQNYKLAYYGYLADLNCQPQFAPIQVAVQAQGTIKKEKDMSCYHASAVAVQEASKPLELKQMDYLIERLETVVAEKKAALRVKFFIDEPSQPKTFKELRERLKKGEYTLDMDDRTEDAQIPYYTEASRYISWRVTAADKDGYAKAKEVLMKDKTKVEDAIMSFVYEDALKALVEFEKAK